MRIRLDKIIDQIIEEYGKEQRRGRSTWMTVEEVVLRAKGEPSVARLFASIGGGLLGAEIALTRYMRHTAAESLRRQRDIGGVRHWTNEQGRGYRLTALLSVSEIEAAGRSYLRRGGNLITIGKAYLSVADHCRAAGLSDESPITSVYDKLAASR